MRKEKNKSNKPIILFPILAQPPHIGHLLMLNTILPLASKIIVVLYNRETVMKVEASKQIIDAIINNYKDKDKIEVVVSNIDFSTINELPEEFLNKKAFYIATCSRNIYSNLQIKGYPYLIFLKKPIGWRDFFESCAYMRSLALYGLEKATNGRI